MVNKHIFNMYWKEIEATIPLPIVYDIAQFRSTYLQKHFSTRPIARCPYESSLFFFILVHSEHKQQAHYLFVMVDKKNKQDPKIDCVWIAVRKAVYPNMNFRRIESMEYLLHYIFIEMTYNLPVGGLDLPWKCRHYVCVFCLFCSLCAALKPCAHCSVVEFICMHYFYYWLQ